MPYIVYVYDGARLGELADIPIYDIPYVQIKKKVAIKNHIWGL